jgi:hypothetical protein
MMLVEELVERDWRRVYKRRVSKRGPRKSTEEISTPWCVENGMIATLPTRQEREKLT